MTGVEILSSTQVVSEYAFNWLWFWIIFAAVFIIGVVSMIYGIVTDGFDWKFVCVMLLISAIGGSLIGGMLGGAAHIPAAYETHYKVTIDDSVSMNEFLDKYEILDQEGKIYTVREREK